MGYLSDYKIEVEGDETQIVMNAISMQTKEDDAHGEDLAIACDGTITVCDTKWYEMEEDIDAVTAAMPHVTLTVTRCGEENPDVEKTVSRGGKHVSAQAVFTFPDLDTSSLPPVQDRQS